MDRSHRELELFHAILDHSHDSIVITDGDQTIQYWSDSASRLFGFERAEAIGHSIEELLIPPRLRSDAREQFERLLDSGASRGIPRVIEIEALQKSGDEISVALTLTSILLDDQRWIVGIVRNDTARKRREADLQKKATTDSLSGLANRAEFQRHLESNLNNPIALAIIDLDEFKMVNDGYGHLVGDAAIEFVSGKFTEHFAEAVCCARLGGDEFGLLVSVVSRDLVLAQIEQLRADIESSTFADGEIEVTISVGITFGQPGDTARTLLGRADELLYQSKNSGRNRVSWR